MSILSSLNNTLKRILTLIVSSKKAKEKEIGQKRTRATLRIKMTKFKMSLHTFHKMLMKTKIYKMMDQRAHKIAIFNNKRYKKTNLKKL